MHLHLSENRYPGRLSETAYYFLFALIGSFGLAGTAAGLVTIYQAVPKHQTFQIVQDGKVIGYSDVINQNGGQVALIVGIAVTSVSILLVALAVVMSTDWFERLLDDRYERRCERMR